MKTENTLIGGIIMITEKLQNLIDQMYQKPVKECSEKELYFALLSLVKEEAKNRGINEGKKKLYYISAEFLIGK